MKWMASTALACTAGTCGSAFAQSSVTLYGVFDTSIQYTHNTGGASNRVKLQSGQMPASQLGDVGQARSGRRHERAVQLAERVQREYREDEFRAAVLAQGLCRLDGWIRHVDGRPSAGYVEGSRVASAGRQFSRVFHGARGRRQRGRFGAQQQCRQMGEPVMGRVAGGRDVRLRRCGGIGRGRAGLQRRAFVYRRATDCRGRLHALDNGNALRSTRGASSADTIFLSRANNAYATASAVNIARTGAPTRWAPLHWTGITATPSICPTQARRTARPSATTTVRFVAWQASPAWLLQTGYNYLKSHGASSATYQQVTLAADYARSKRTDIYAAASYVHASGKSGAGGGFERLCQWREVDSRTRDRRHSPPVLSAAHRRGAAPYESLSRDDHVQDLPSIVLLDSTDSISKIHGLQHASATGSILIIMGRRICVSNSLKNIIMVLLSFAGMSRRACDRVRHGVFQKKCAEDDPEVFSNRSADVSGMQ